MDKSEINRVYLKQYAESVLTRGIRGRYSCPCCGSGTKKNKSGALSVGLTEWRCFSCGAHGDIYAMYGFVTGIGDGPETLPERIRAIEDLYGIPHEAPDSTRAPKKKTISSLPGRAEESDFSAFYASCEDIGATDYLRRRGITDETARRFGVRFCPAWKHPKAPESAPTSSRVIVPICPGQYLARATEAGAMNPKQKAGTLRHVFNWETLYDTQDERPVWIAEGEIDAMSIEQTGLRAVGLGSTSNYRLLGEAKPEAVPCFFVAMDCDAAGKNAAGEIADFLREKGFAVAVAKPGVFCEYKDASEALQENPDGLRVALANEEPLLLAQASKTEDEERAEALQDYRKTLASTALDALLAEAYGAPVIPSRTGFTALDDALGGGLYPGRLYILGAVSSLGKTTLVLNIAQALSRQGKDVLYFCLEQSASDLTAKALSALCFKHARVPADRFTELQICRGDMKGNSSFTGVLEDFRANEGAHLHLFERRWTQGASRSSVAFIRSAVDAHIRLERRSPVVIVDYLQLLDSPDPHLSDKQATDRNIADIKALLQEYPDVTVIGISSFNRASYNTDPDMASFKESGTIEYSADVLMTLKPHGADSVDACKSSEVRGIDLCILKNRRGAVRTTKPICFCYVPKYNFYTSDVAPESGGKVLQMFSE